MPVVDTTRTFTNNEQITSVKLNEIMDNSSFVSGAVVTSGGLEVTAGGQMQVATSGITTTKIANLNVTTEKIANEAVTPAKLSPFGPAWSNGLTNFNIQQNILELATGITSNSGCFIDFHSVHPLTDYETRIVRDTGVDGWFQIDNKGAGRIVFTSAGGFQFANAHMPNPVGSAPIFGARAWVNFNGQANTDIAGTYARTSSTTVTITATAHGFIAGNSVYLDFTVGTGTAPFDGLYLVNSVTDANTFTVISSTTTTSTGTATLKRKTIRGSGNVSNVSAAYSGANPASPPAANQIIDNGYYVLNFATAMPDANFAISGSCNESGALAAASGNDIINGFGYNEKCSFITTINITGVATDCLHNSVQVIR